LFLYCCQEELLRRQDFVHPLLNAAGTIEAAVFKECEFMVALLEKLFASKSLEVLFVDTSGPKRQVDFEEGLDNTLSQTHRASKAAKFLTRQRNKMGIFMENFAETCENLKKDNPEDPANCLILGETGTGKEYIADSLSESWPGPDGAPRKFAKVDCTSIPPSLMESELFGHVKGAFTGAFQKHDGQLSRANNGTLFLDEIGLTTTEFQSKLLRFMEQKTFRKVGSSEDEKRTLCRVIAATSRDLKEETANNRFLPDLFFRLTTIILRIPPLRERREDILLLFRHFCPARKLSPSAQAALFDFAWPGNVRELKQIAKRVSLSKGAKRVAFLDLPLRIRNRYRGYSAFQMHLEGAERLEKRLHPVDPQTAETSEGLWQLMTRLDDRYNELRIKEVKEALSRCGKNITWTAEILKMDRNKLIRFMKKNNLD